jgi:1-acyl-sn-glycerol-3-phosphate acyltransferase
LFYWIFKWSLFTPVVRLVWRPKVTGLENITSSGPAIVVCNHTSAVETFIVPAVIPRRLTFPAKAELFAEGGGLGKRIVAWFLAAVGQVPMDRSGGRASAGSMDSVLQVLRNGELLAIFPEGTRSPDGRLYKGKTGVARLVLQAKVPVIPVGIRDSVARHTKRLGIPYYPRTKISIGQPIEFDRYAPAAGDRDVLRYVTDEIMAAVQQQSGQVYVDAYGASVKAALADGRELASAVVEQRPGLGRPVPPLPVASTEPVPGPVDAAPTETAQDVAT